MGQVRMGGGQISRNRRVGCLVQNRLFNDDEIADLEGEFGSVFAVEEVVKKGGFELLIGSRNGGVIFGDPSETAKLETVSRSQSSFGI